MKRNFVDYLRTDDEAGANISWGSVFAGVVTFISIFITLSFIGSAIGFGLLEPTSDDPINGAGTGVIIWTVVAFFLSFAIAGFVAGLTSKRVGMVHGFLTWATTTLVLVILVSNSAIAAISGVGSLIGSTAKVTGQGVGNVASGTGDLISKGVKELTEDIDVDTDTLQADIEKFLQDTDEEELQPEYLQNEIDKSLEEIKSAAQDIVETPDNADQIINKTADTLKERAEKIGQNVDRDAISSAVAKNSDLSEDEAKKATDEIYEGYQKAVAETQKAIDATSEKMTELSEQAKQTIADARQTAEDAAGATSRASIWAFVAMILAMVAASGCGVLGGRVGSNPRVQDKA